MKGRNNGNDGLVQQQRSRVSIQRRRALGDELTAVPASDLARLLAMLIRLKGQCSANTERLALRIHDRHTREAFANAKTLGDLGQLRERTRAQRRFDKVSKSDSQQLRPLL